METEPNGVNTMQNELFEQFTSVSKTTYESLQQLGSINSKAIQKLAELQFNFASLGFESSVEQAKLLSNTSNYKDLLSAESSLANDYGSKMLDLTKQTTAVFNESGEEVVAWFEKNVDVLSDSAKSTAKKATTATTAAKKAA